MSKVRAKFTVTEVTKTTWCDRIQLTPVIGNSKENDEFFRTTPCGKLEISIQNPDAAANFNPGDEFYIDFTKVEKQ